MNAVFEHGSCVCASSLPNTLRRASKYLKVAGVMHRSCLEGCLVALYSAGDHQDGAATLKAAYYKRFIAVLTSFSTLDKLVV
jgi:hypothetical protein